MGQQENAWAWSLEKNLWYVHMTCHFGCRLVCGGGEMKSPWKFYTDKKTTINGKDYRNDAWKGYVKTWDYYGEIVKDSRCTAPGPQRGGLTPCGMNPQLQWPTCWHTLGYGLNGHKTQSFMKNGGQQKCLDKVLT